MWIKNYKILYYKKTYDIIFDENSDIEWMRIPHFYKPFYVYQYATGHSAAIALAAAAVLVPVTNFITIPAAAVAYAFADGIIKDKTLLKSENGQEMIKYYKKAAELGHEEAKKKYEKYKKYLKQGW